MVSVSTKAVSPVQTRPATPVAAPGAYWPEHSQHWHQPALLRITLLCSQEYSCGFLFFLGHYILFPVSVSARVTPGFPPSPGLSAASHMGRELSQVASWDKIRDTWGSLCSDLTAASLLPSSIRYGQKLLSKTVFRYIKLNPNLY